MLQKLNNRSLRFMTYTLLVRQKYLADRVFYYKTNIIYSFSIFFQLILFKEKHL